MGHDDKDCSAVATAILTVRIFIISQLPKAHRRSRFLARSQVRYGRLFAENHDLY